MALTFQGFGAAAHLQSGQTLRNFKEGEEGCYTVLLMAMGRRVLWEEGCYAVLLMAMPMVTYNMYRLN